VDKRYQLKKLSKKEIFEKALNRVREQAVFLHKLYYKNDEKISSTENVDN
jgi:hypothetical protein